MRRKWTLRPIIVGQMGMSAFRRALAAGVDVVVAGRACDTAIFAALPAMLAFLSGPRSTWPRSSNARRSAAFRADAIRSWQRSINEGFELESMAPQRRATPVSVAAHSLYEQSDPFTVQEPEGRLDLARATYHALDDRRTRVVGAVWEEAREPWVKIEGARRMWASARSCSPALPIPRFIARHEQLLQEVESVVRDLVCEDAAEDYVLTWRVYGVNGVRMTPVIQTTPLAKPSSWANASRPRGARAAEVVRTTKQYLLHHGYEGRLSTAGNLAFPFTPPEVSVGPAYRFNVYHLMRARNLDALFPLEIETV